MTHDPAHLTSPSSCCEEFAAAARVTRRGLLGGALAGGLALTFGSTVVQAAPARAAAARGVLVVLSLRGAADGLSLVVPHGDPVYAAARPRLAVPAAQVLASDGFFGLHPALAPLLPLWQAGRMAAVHAAGLPARNRSHFSAMEDLEDAAPGSTTRVGWLNRMIGSDGVATPLQALAMGPDPVPASLVGPAPYLSADRVDDVKIAGADEWDTTGGRLRSLHTLWDGARGRLGSTARSSFQAVADFAPVLGVPAEPGNGAAYPESDLGRALGQVARTVRGDVGVEVFTVDHGSWDMHSGLGTLEWGEMKQKAGDLAASLAAFFTDLGPAGDAVTVVCLSEFGRRVAENDNYGLDHGYGTTMFVLGAGVRGGYVATWPGLAGDLDADLLVTTDYRSVLAEVIGARFGASLPTVFPGFSPQRVGVMAGV